MSAQSIVVKVGTLGHFAMTSRKWNSARQVGEITFEDAHGTEYRCESLGMTEPEIRQAIYDEIVRVKVRGGARLITEADVEREFASLGPDPFERCPICNRKAPCRGHKP